MGLESYNGYTSKERDKKYQEYKRLRGLGLTPPEVGPCQLCGDPTVPVEAHSEDYSLPYEFGPPAEYMICGSCHYWLHARFGKPAAWMQFKSHLSRGGYAREFSSPAVSRERAAALSAVDNGTTYQWHAIEGRIPRPTGSWWEHLSVDPQSKTASWARPRPSRERPTVQAYRDALALIAPSASEFALLHLHARAPLRCLTMRDAAIAVYHKPVAAIANLAYGKLSRRLAQTTKWEPDRRSDGSPIWMSAVAEGWQPPGREFEWVLVPQLVALFKDGTVPA